ncbi:polysaccharide deacetylase family protein [Rhodoligotrophos defluvii]|uniref:polysaccharide deacetylase family protein n=1 Tax=Rhodoligotrophos defluvii TaxID=2561934 RepID=UPI0010C9D8A4|nr:polysaccharide deacetylase family protein [Rhodoligotrophos defluvii]
MLPDRLVLTFHGLGRPAGAIDPAEAPYWVDTSVLHEAVDAARRDPRIEITFDDGYASDFHIACPVLAQAGLSATFFVLAGRLGQQGSLSKSDLAEMAAMGMRIGNHGHDHVNWTKCADDTLRRELYDARAVIEDAAGCAVDTLSVPFGAFDARVLRTAFAAGYRRVHTSSGGLAHRGARLVPRNTVRSDLDVGRMIADLTGWQSRARSAVRDPIRRWRYGVNTWAADRAP